jgi:hypothetical protein
VAEAGQIDYPRLLFTEVQRFRQPWMFVLAGVVSIVPAGLILYAYFSTRAIGLRFLLGVLVACMVMPAMMMFMGLRVTVTSDLLAIDFFPWPRKRIPSGEIASAAAETYHPIKEFGGWGFRWSLKESTVVYSVSGNRGVRITMNGGKKMMIGSQQAEELAAALSGAGGVKSESVVKSPESAAGQ